MLSLPNQDVVFIVGSASNQVQFYALFDAIVLLSAPTDVVVERIRRRTNNPFGKSDAELAKILHDTATFEPKLRRAAHFELITDRPLDEVVDDILKLTVG